MRMATNQSNDVFDPFTSTGLASTVTEGFKDLEEFDPFHIGVPSPKSKKGASTKKSPERKLSGGAVAVSGRASTALPPRLDIKFKVHEEISSTTDQSEENDGSSDIFVEGTVLAQVTSSDALKNAPFILVTSSPLSTHITFSANKEYAKTYTSIGQTIEVNVVKIPKTAVGFVEAGNYQLTEKVAHMPMLLERKITRSKRKVQIAVQVRSKLSNQDDMKEMSILLSISDKIAGDTVEVNLGEGEWDRVSRTILWRLEQLPKGESFLVSARCKLTEDNEHVETSELAFPVMMRCQSDDQISSAQFQAIEASGYPATVSCITVQKSFRILHRLI